jgi:uncharacterized repeat protein (TIGR02543 family)
MENGYITEPAVPSKSNYLFGGWYTDSISFSVEWDFAASIMVSDISLYAKWDLDLPFIADTSLLELEISPSWLELIPSFDPDITAYTIKLACPPESVELEILAEAMLGLSVKYGGIADSLGRAVISGDSAGNHIITITSFANDSVYKTYTITVQQNLNSSLLRQLWNGVIALNLNPLTNGGHTFTEFMWFLDGNPIYENGDIVRDKYLYVASGLQDNGSYNAVIKTSLGETLEVCPYIYHKSSEAFLAAFPNPVSRGSTLRVLLPSQRGEKEQENLYIIDQQGRMLQTVSVDKNSKEVFLSVDWWDFGVYTIKFGYDVIKVVVIKR